MLRVRGHRLSVVFAAGPRRPRGSREGTRSGLLGGSTGPIAFMGVSKSLDLLSVIDACDRYFFAHNSGSPRDRRSSLMSTPRNTGDRPSPRVSTERRAPGLPLFSKTTSVFLGHVRDLCLRQLWIGVSPIELICRLCVAFKKLSARNHEIFRFGVRENRSIERTIFKAVDSHASRFV